MKRTTKKLAATIMTAALLAPVSAFAADDVQQKVDALQKELETLKQQMTANESKTKKIEEKSLGRWLTIGGDYRFRLDSLRGETKAYTDPQGLFTWLGKNALLQVDGTTLGFPNPVTVGTVLTQANYNIQNITTYQQAKAQAATFANMINTLAGLVAANPLALTQTGVSVPAYKPKNDTLYTNRLGLNLHAKATQDVTVNVRLVAYKTFGAQDDAAVTNSSGSPFFADRVGVFDGTIGHVPSSSLLDVDRAYATWSNIADQPIWISIGRRPSTNGAPTNIRLNNPRPGNGGTPALLVDYAFDGMTLGYAPDIEALPGAYTKICYGRGFENGFVGNTATASNSIHDTDMLGVAVIPVDTDPLRVWMQWNRGFNIFDFPVMNNTAFGNTAPSIDLGAIDWYGAGFMSTLKKVGPGELNFFGDFGVSITHPNDNVSANAGFQGLLTGGFFAPEAPKDKTGWATYVGMRYDYKPTATKLGFEYNHGSENWITFAPAADDIWTSKLGTRGNVYEGYLIQELKLKPISSYLSKAFFRLGFQYYDFEYTGSNNWVGAPVKISDVKSTDMMLLTPLKSAQNLYATFEVHF